MRVLILLLFLSSCTMMCPDCGEQRIYNEPEVIWIERFHVPKPIYIHKNKHHHKKKHHYKKKYQHRKRP